MTTPLRTPDGEPFPAKHPLSYYKVLGALAGEIVLRDCVTVNEAIERAAEKLKRCKPTRTRRAKRWGEL